MNSSSLSLIAKQNAKMVIVDILAVLFIYFTPAISHLINLPVYFIEPMRLILILSFAHLTKKNTYLLALSLPLFSHFISAHPGVLKTVLISFELIFCSFLFYELSKKFNRVFFIMLSSIIISKFFYYIFKYLFIYFGFISTELISTPIYIQIITTIAFSIYVSYILNKNKSGILNFRKSDNGKQK